MTDWPNRGECDDDLSLVLIPVGRTIGDGDKDRKGRLLGEVVDTREVPAICEDDSDDILIVVALKKASRGSSTILSLLCG